MEIVVQAFGMDAALGELGRAVRYALGGNARTARLIALMLVAVFAYSIML